MYELDDHHMQLGAAEAAACAPSPWERWAEAVEAILGHSLDGDGAIDGYSLDEAFDAWRAGQHDPHAYASVVRAATLTPSTLTK